MKRVLSLLFVCGLLCVLPVHSPQAKQDNDGPGKGWKSIKNRSLSLDVPDSFQTTKGVGPGYLGQIQFTLTYISGGDLSQGLFASSGYGSFPKPYGATRDDIKEMEEEFLEKFFAPLDIPGVGRFACDPSQAKTSEYKALGASVRETNAKSYSSGREYRIYFVLSMESRGSQIRMSYIIAGCPKNKIEDNNRVMSSILSSVSIE